MFCDQTILKLYAGNGGDGCVAFRREKFVAMGGPNGGDGGTGGSILMKVKTALNTLRHLDTYKQFAAEKGEFGKGQNKHGRNGEDLILEVPLGTIVRQIIRNEEGEIIEKKEIADLSRVDKTVLLAKGGRGGYGNAHFVSSVRQAPKFAELGEEGEFIEVELELKLVADIGIIGIPSAGKSTLISVISNAKPKIAAYPFTTLKPNLGVVKIDDEVTYVVADIPGLIEKAHEGKGLGIQFLKHVQRCRLLVHLIDPSQGETINNFHIINRELEAFSPELGTKKQIVIINKADITSEEELKDLNKELMKATKGDARFILYPEAISAATTKGIPQLKTSLFQELQKITKPEWLETIVENDETYEEEEKEHILHQPHLEDPKYYSVERIDEEHFKVAGQRINQIVNMSDLNNREAMMRVYDVFKKMGIYKELKKQGIQDGNIVIVGKRELEFQSDW